MPTWQRLASLAILALTLIPPTTVSALAQDQSDEPPEVRTLLAESVSLSSGPVCWDVDERTDPPGSPGDVHVSALDLIYQSQGRQDIAINSSAASRLEAGSAVLVAADAVYRHANAGSVPSVAISFSGSCDTEEAAGPNERHAGNTGSLGFRPGPRPTTLTLRTGRSGRGSQGPVVSHPGPVTYFILEGETAIWKVRPPSAWPAGCVGTAVATSLLSRRTPPTSTPMSAAGPTDRSTRS
jgi:hypothetical protein